MTSWLLERLGFTRLIKIPGRSFDELSDEEVALMIESHLTGNETSFDQTALSEFMLIPNRSPRLERTRLKIVEIDESCRTLDQLDGLRTDSGLAELENLVHELRS